MGEVRECVVTGQRVIYAPARARRPQDFAKQRQAGAGPSSAPADCPFCPGHEALLAEIILEVPDGSGQSWKTRVVLNKYPAVTPNDTVWTGSKDAEPAVGRHEVIIETPRHDGDAAALSPGEYEAVIETYLNRFRSIMSEGKFKSIHIFRNHGGAAGTSLRHPHSQLIALATIPPAIAEARDRAFCYFTCSGRSVFADLLEIERDSGRRIVCENACFVAFVPYAAEVPFEIWIMPKRQQPSFCDIEPAENKDLGALLGTCLRRLQNRLGDPAYNYVIMTTSGEEPAQPWLCWYLRIVPRFTNPAGFELGSGMHINPSIPEQDAAYLREGPKAAARGRAE